MSQLGSFLQAPLNFTPGGNPYGATPLGLSYGQSYNSALQANQQNYNNIVKLYQDTLTNVGNTLGQGGTPWGVAGPAAQAIADTQAQQTGGAIQNSINRGVGSTTAATAAQRGANYDAQKAYAGLGAQLGQTYAGYQSNLGQGLAGFLNSVQIPYPNAGAYNQILSMQGAYQQAQADRQAALGAGAASRYFSSVPAGGGIMAGGGGSRSGISSPFSGGAGGAPLTLSDLGIYKPNNYSFGENSYGGYGYGVPGAGLGTYQPIAPSQSYGSGFVGNGIGGVQGGTVTGGTFGNPYANANWLPIGTAGAGGYVGSDQSGDY